jgi:hypothetical protein
MTMGKTVIYEAAKDQGSQVELKDLKGSSISKLVSQGKLKDPMEYTKVKNLVNSSITKVGKHQGESKGDDHKYSLPPMKKKIGKETNPLRKKSKAMARRMIRVKINPKTHTKNHPRFLPLPLKVMSLMVIRTRIKIITPKRIRRKKINQLVKGQNFLLKVLPFYYIFDLNKIIL